MKNGRVGFRDAEKRKGERMAREMPKAPIKIGNCRVCRKVTQVFTSGFLLQITLREVEKARRGSATKCCDL